MTTWFARSCRRSLQPLRDAPAASATAVSSLAIGFGGVLALVAAYDAFVVRPLPVPRPDRLVAIEEVRPDGRGTGISLDGAMALRSESATLAAVAVGRVQSMALRTGARAGSEPVIVPVAQVTADWAAVVAAVPAAGRFFSAEEVQGELAVAVLSHRLWTRRLGQAVDVVGKRVRLNDVPHTVVGVLPQAEALPIQGRVPEVFVPLPGSRYGGNRRLRTLEGFARLAPAARLTGVATELGTVASTWAAADPAHHRDWGLRAVPLGESLRGIHRRPLRMLLAAGGLMAMAALANVAGLMAARHLARRRRWAVRVALGARATDLLRMAWVETLPIVVLGTGLGLVVARALLDGLPTVLRLMGGSAPPEAWVMPTLVGRTLLLMLPAVLVTTLGLASIPFVVARRLTLRTALTGGARDDGRRPGWGRGALVTGQVAASVVLLLAAGLLLRSLGILLASDPGYDARQVLRFGLGLPESRYDERAQVLFHRGLIGDLREVTGVEAVGAVARLPLSTRRFTSRYALDGAVYASREEQPRAAINVASGGFFEALGVPLIAGRLPDRRDGVDSNRVLVVNRAWAAVHGGPGAVLGARMTLGWRSALHPAGAAWQVIGVVGDMRQHGLDQPPAAELYLPIGQFPVDGASYLLRARTDADLAVIAEVAREKVAARDAQLQRVDPGRFTTWVRDSVADRRLAAVLVAALGAVALALTVVGVHGIVAAAVAMRRHELAVRIALGADGGRIRRLLWVDALRWVVPGLALGTMAFVWVAPLVRDRLVGVGTGDPATLATVALLVLGLAFVTPLPFVARARSGISRALAEGAG